MKQTKKLTRSQREYLNSHGIKTEGVRLVRETHQYIEYKSCTGETKRLWKGGIQYVF